MGRAMQKSKLKSTLRTEDIPQKLVDMCDDLKNREQNSNAQNINYKHQLGQSFLTVESKPDVYGKDGVSNMMALLGITRKKDVDRVKAFAEQYTIQQVEAYNHRYDNVNWAKIRISWSHWDKLLVGYLSKKQREEWMDAAARNGWSCSELGRQLSKEFEKGPKHGRNVTIPNAKKAYLSKISKSLETVKTYYEKMWTDKTNPATVQLTSDLSDVDEDTLVAVSELIDGLKDTMDCLQAMAKDMKSMNLEKLYSQKLQDDANSPEAKELESEVDAFVDSLL